MANERMISADAVQAIIERLQNEPQYQHPGEDFYCGVYAVESAICGLPITVMRKGRWFYNAPWNEWECTQCGNGIGNGKKYLYCPYCGAYMGEENEKWQD